ncbi:MAG: 50S ribosomal protein L15 [Patescibacteria group bacterium]
MTVTLHTLKPSPGAQTKTRRLGRGNASSRGTYSGKGQKGQRARTGGKNGLKLMGMRRMIQNVPKKRGFVSRYAKPAVVNLKDLSIFAAGSLISPKELVKKGLVRDTGSGVKILGQGELKVEGLRFQDCEISLPAREKIEKARGVIEIKDTKKKAKKS